jgi:IS5 family transposase
LKKSSLEAVGFMQELREKLSLMEQVVACAWRVFNGEKVPASDRIFSIFEPHTELLKRGKSRKPVEFGHMVTIGQTAEKFISFYNVEEQSRHDIDVGDQALLREHKKAFGAYPGEFTADKNYYGGPSHLAKWESRIPLYAVGKKGRRDEGETEREHGFLFRLLQKFRAGCEGTISVLKRAFGLYRCLFRGFKSFASSVGSTVFCHNLVVLSRL